MLLSATHWTPVMAPLEAAFALFKTFCITCRATTLNCGGDFRRDQSQSSGGKRSDVRFSCWASWERTVGHQPLLRPSSPKP